MCILLIVFLTGFLSHGFAANTGKIAGQIVDQTTNEPVAGANVVVEGTSMGGASDADGYFVVLNLAPGNYTIQVSMIGYSTARLENVRVSVNQTTSLEVKIGEEAITGETVIVYAERPVVQLDVSSSQRVISAEEIAARPVDNLEEILGAEAGVNFTAGEDGQGLIVRGGQLSETDIVVDGMSTRNLRNQQANTTIALSSVQEIELLTGGFTAEYGEIRSGLVNIITKEGSPEKYSVSFDGRISPAGRKHYGPSPYGTDGPWWSVYAGPDAMTGVTQEMVDAGEYDRAFIGWEKWSQTNLEDNDPNNDYTPQQALEIWKWQHRTREYADKPDYIGDMTISGPIPFIPVTFMLSQRYEDLQIAYPMSRNNSIASTTLLKLTHQLSSTMKLSLNSNYILVEGVSGGGAFDFSTGIVTGTREGTNYALDNVESGEGAGGNWMWYDGAYSPVQTKQYSSSLVFNHVLNPTTFYNVQAEYKQFKTEQRPDTPYRNTDGVVTIGDVTLDESPRGFSGYITEQYDITGKDFTSGGGRGQDNSSYWGIDIRADLVSQLHKNHEVKVGLGFDYTEFKERRETNHSEITTPYEENPRTWWRYDQSPIKMSAYIQDKMEFEGLIANIGVRLDHITPGVDRYNLDPDYIFANDPYGYDAFIADDFSYKSQEGKSSSKTYIQPRLGISHPITEVSKVFFNYGHFLQPPLVDELYLTRVSNAGGRVPNLGAEWPRTIAYELGMEQGVLDNILVRFTGFYKDVSNELDGQTIENRDGTISVSTLKNNIYRDIRGFELRIEKRGGNWWYGWVQGEYLVQSSGLIGLGNIYEDRQKAALQSNAATQQKDAGVPSIKANLTLHTPSDFGPALLGHHVLGGWRLNWLQDWADGGESLLNSDAPIDQQIYVEVIDYINTDILLEKRVDIDKVRMSFYMQVKNLFDNKGFPHPNNWNQYVNSLRFPHENGELKGNDKLGEWDKDHIELGWNTWSQFVNPRDIFFGIRFNF